MTPLVAEYRALPPKSDGLPDGGDNFRKCEIIGQLDGQIFNLDVADLLLEILKDSEEFDLARVEAIKLVGILFTEQHPLCNELRAELLRIFADYSEDEMIRGWAERFVCGRPWSPHPW